VDQADLELPQLEEQQQEAPLDEETIKSLAEWLKESLGDRISEVQASKRLINSPAMILNQDAMMTSSMRRVMQTVHKESGFMSMGQYVLAINPRHELIKRLAALRQKDEDFARLAAEQIFDNSLVSAGLMEDSRNMVNRMYEILERALSK
jgi:molecular chaperone HtpG